MTFMRWIGVGVFGLGLLNLGNEMARALTSQRGFRLLDTGEVWADLHRSSLLTLQPAVERYLTPWLWDPVILTILTTPLTPMALILGTFILIATSPRLRLR